MSTKSSAPIRRLYCSCCGESAGRWHQHWNMDTGFGACVRCITFMRARGETEDEIVSRYGTEGVSWGMSILVYGLAFRVVAAFGEHEQDGANEWMLKHATHGLIAIHEGLFLLADINDQGTKPTASTPVGRPAPAGNLRVFPRPGAGAVNKENNARSADAIERTIVAALREAAPVFEAAKNLRTFLDIAEALAQLGDGTLRIEQGPPPGAGGQRQAVMSAAMGEAANVYDQRAITEPDKADQFRRQAAEARIVRAHVDSGTVCIVPASKET